MGGDAVGTRQQLHGLHLLPPGIPPRPAAGAPLVEEGDRPETDGGIAGPAQETAPGERDGRAGTRRSDRVGVIGSRRYPDMRQVRAYVRSLPRGSTVVP